MNYLNRISPTSCLSALSAPFPNLYSALSTVAATPLAIPALPWIAVRQRFTQFHNNLALTPTAVPRRYNETQRCGELPESELLRLRFRHGSQLSHRLLNNALKQHPIGGSRYQVHYRQNPDFRVYHELVEANALARPGELFFASAEPRFREAIEQFLTLLIEKTDSAEAVRLLDYRQYYELRHGSCRGRRPQD